MKNVTGRIVAYNRIIPTIGKHIVANKALAGGGEGIRIKESADLGIVIAALEVVEPGFLGIDIATALFFGVFSRACPGAIFTPGMLN